METYPEMNEKIVEILRLVNSASTLYAAARVKELEQQVEELKEQLKEAQLKNTELCLDFHTEMQEDKVAIHIHKKSLDEYAQTLYRLRKELKIERELRQDAEKALAIATSTLEWYATAYPGCSGDALMKIEDLLSPEAMWRIVEIEQQMKKEKER